MLKTVFICIKLLIIFVDDIFWSYSKPKNFEVSLLFCKYKRSLMISVTFLYLSYKQGGNITLEVVTDSGRPSACVSECVRRHLVGGLLMRRTGSRGIRTHVSCCPDV